MLRDFGKGNANVVCMCLHVEGIGTFQAFSRKPNFDYMTIWTYHMFHGMDLHLLRVHEYMNYDYTTIWTYHMFHGRHQSLLRDFLGIEFF